ncbi:MAG TPA: FxLYD domain-containing protein [Bryobacteraceae bacterium]|nr:FxLYD domain-containing protein [Bryobacteraceae bacterium]
MADWRGFFKRMAYAGLERPSNSKLPLGERLRRRLDRLADRLAGTPPPVDDPLYETNRAWRQKIRLALYIALPFVAALVVLLISSNFGWLRNKPSTAPVEPAKLVSSLPPGVLRSSELEISEMFLQKDAHPPLLHGKVLNHSTSAFEAAEISFNVTDKDGMLLGAVSATVRNVAPGGSQEFTVPVPLAGAAIVLVRDARRM